VRALLTLALAGAHIPGCNTDVCDRRMTKKAHAKTVKRWRRVVRPYDPWLTRTARCESGLRWHIATGNGFYGGLQFTLSSWRAVGGGGFPHWATPLEQKYRGVRLLWVQGRGAWPVCG
jgi:hypothetical protein